MSDTQIIHTHTRICGHFGVPSSPQEHVPGLWEEAGEPGERPERDHVNCACLEFESTAFLLSGDCADHWPTTIALLQRTPEKKMRKINCPLFLQLYNITHSNLSADSDATIEHNVPGQQRCPLKVTQLTFSTSSKGSQEAESAVAPTTGWLLSSGLINLTHSSLCGRRFLQLHHFFFLFVFVFIMVEQPCAVFNYRCTCA